MRYLIRDVRKTRLKLVNLKWKNLKKVNDKKTRAPKALKSSL